MDRPRTNKGHLSTNRGNTTNHPQQDFSGRTNGMRMLVYWPDCHVTLEHWGRTFDTPHFIIARVSRKLGLEMLALFAQFVPVADHAPYPSPGLRKYGPRKK
jgi:hypothetical protein